MVMAPVGGGAPVPQLPPALPGQAMPQAGGPGQLPPELIMIAQKLGVPPQFLLTPQGMQMMQGLIAKLQQGGAAGLPPGAPMGGPEELMQNNPAATMMG